MSNNPTTNSGNGIIAAAAQQNANQTARVGNARRVLPPPDLPPLPPTLLERLGAAIRELAVLSFYLILFGVMHHPAFDYFKALFFGGVRGDTGLYLWLLEYNSKHVLTFPSVGFDIGFFFPYGRALAYSDNFLLPSLLGKGLLLAGLPLNIAFNTLYVVASVLTGYCTYRLAYFCTASRLAAIYSGALFMFSSFLTSHMGHPQLQFAFVLPAALHATLLFVTSKSRSAAAAIGLTILAAFLCSVYYAVFAILLVALVFLAFFLMRLKAFSGRDILRLVGFNAPGIVILWGLTVPYLQVKEALGGRRLAEAESFSGSLRSLVAAPPQSWLWEKLLAPLSIPECYLFPGFLTLALSLGVLWQVLRRVGGSESHRSVFKDCSKVFALILSWLVLVHLFPLFDLKQPALLKFALIVLPFWLLLFSTIALLFLFGRKRIVENNRSLGVNEGVLLLLLIAVFFSFASLGIFVRAKEAAQAPTLFYAMFKLLPGVDSIRASGRIGVVTGLAFALLAGFASLQIIPSAGRHRYSPFRFACYLALLTISLLELRTTGLPAVAEPQPSGAYQQLAALSKSAAEAASANPQPHLQPGAVIALPFIFVRDNRTGFAITQTEYMRDLQPSNLPIVNGYSGKMPPYQQNLDLETRGFPSKKSLTTLGQIVGLRYIVYNPRFARSFDADSFEQQLAEHTDELTLITKDEVGNYLLEFHPRLQFRNANLLIIPDSSHERTVHLNLTRKVEQSPDLPTLINVRTGAITNKRGEKEDIFQRLAVGEVGISKNYQITIPPSFSPVRPHSVQLQAEGLGENDYLIATDIWVE